MILQTFQAHELRRNLRIYTDADVTQDIFRPLGVRVFVVLTRVVYSNIAVRDCLKDSEMPLTTSSKLAASLTSMLFPT